MFDDDYEDRMHDIRQDEQQETPMSNNAAQKAVEAAISGCLGYHLEMVAKSMRNVNAEVYAREVISSVATAVLAVLSETHEVVELPEPGYEDEFAAQWGEDDDCVYARKGSGKVRLYVSDPRTVVDEAHMIAGQLLAAARSAEATQ